MNDPIITADKKFRKQVIITLVISLPVCVAIYLGFKMYFLKVPNESEVTGLIQRAKSAILWISIVNGLVSAWLASRLVFLSIRTFQLNQFPPPGFRVIRDTKIRTGRHARAACVLLVVAAILVLSTNLFLFFLHQEINDLMRQLAVY